MSRYEYQGITEQYKASIRRMADARILRMQSHWQGAMYLAGYAVECRLKARLMEIYHSRNLKELQERLAERFNDERLEVASHNIERLMSYTGAIARLTKNKETLIAYRICLKWKPAWRYEPTNGDQRNCEEFFEAVRHLLGYLDANL